MPNFTRRDFVTAVSGGCVASPLLFTITTSAQAQSNDEKSASSTNDLPPNFPAQDPDLAREIVGKSHRDLDSVKKMVESRPSLAKAAWDWGFGDWETALGAASHVGRPDIAEVLIAHGARPDIFAHAMLGNLDAVKAIVAANPGIQRTHGPHSITLLRHAEAGGDRAKAVLEYLQSLGDADHAPKNLEIDASTQAAMLGTYAYELGADGGSSTALTCAIVERRGGLAFKHGDSPRNLFHQGNGEFHPAGAPHVRIIVRDNTLTIVDGDINIKATKSA
jgi:hypothetical protein